MRRWPISRELKHVEKNGKQIWIQRIKISKKKNNKKTKKNPKKTTISRELRHVEKKRKQIWIQRIKISKKKQKTKENPLYLEN